MRIGTGDDAGRGEPSGRRRDAAAVERRSVVVVGAGAAGSIAALFAARRGVDVLLLERTVDGGRKILISGGGRCNILPSALAPDRFVTDSSPHTLRKVLTSWPQSEQRAFLERELSMRLVLEEETGKLFPATQKARDVRDGLYERARESGVEFRFRTKVTQVEPGDAGFLVHVESTPDPSDLSSREASPIAIHAHAVVLATGGLSVPKTGSDAVGFGIARALGHELHATYPALTPLTADPPVHASLSGIALDVTLRSRGGCPPFSTTDAFLFTHRGYSGPAVLDASHIVSRARLAGKLTPLLVQWTRRGREEWEGLLRGGSGTVGSLLAQELPTRLARQLLSEAEVASDVQLAQLSREARYRIVTLLTEYKLPASGDEGYKKAEVTGGGVPLSQIDPRTMESRLHPRLYFCGEILDAFGPIGGHNFSWAWATGRLAGLSAS